MCTLPHPICEYPPRQCLGEDPDREGLVRTPERAAKALLFFTQGYTQTVGDAPASLLPPTHFRLAPLVVDDKLKC